MESEEFRRVINLIRQKEMDAALNILTKKLSAECIPLIRSKGRNLTHNETLGVFYYAFLDLCDRIKLGKFEFENDRKFISYFKTSCVNQTYNVMKKAAAPFLILPGEVLSVINDQDESGAKNIQKDFIDDKRERYGVQVQIDQEDGSDLISEVEKVFHLLNETCKILILLKYFVKLKHEDISDAMRPFYHVANADVSRVLLNRCINQIKGKIDIEQFV